MLNRDKFKIILFTLSAALNSQFIFAATGTTVTDPTLETTDSNIYNFMTGNIYPALNNMNTTVQLENQTLQNSLTGSSGIGAELNSATEQGFRNWTPTSQDLMNMVQEGLQTGSLADQIKYYNQKFHIPTASDLDPHNPHSEMANYGVLSAVSTNAALGVADKGFDNAQQIVDQINLLYHLIDQQQTVKQGIDLNSAILLKIASLQADLMRLQSQQLKMQALGQEQDNTARNYMASFVQNVK